MELRESALLQKELLFFFFFFFFFFLFLFFHKRHYSGVLTYSITIEPGHSISYKVAYVPSEDADQTAHPRSLLRIFAGYSVAQLAFFINL